MTAAAAVSAIIPTFNRARDVRLAVASAAAQTHPAAALEIIVVDDGGSDDTEAVLAGEFGERVRYLRTPNRGVAAARNHGMAAARGEYLALLDDDDEWHPGKIAAQAAVLAARPEVGLVVTDVERMDARRVTYERFHRRAQFPADGWVVAQAARWPSLVPSSAMFRRSVLDRVGGFDPRLRTAEDLDFLLRVALHVQVAVIAEPLTRATHDHQGLANLPRSYQDHVTAVERFVRDHRAALPRRVRDAALFSAYTRNLRGLLWTGALAEAARVAAGAALHTRTPAELGELRALGAGLARNGWTRARRWVGALSGSRSRR